MQVLNDIVINLQPPINPSASVRVIEVDLSTTVNPAIYTINNQFGYTTDAFGTVSLDRITPNKMIVPLYNNIVLSGILDELAITYSAKSSTGGDSVSGRIVFTGQSFTIGAAPITYNLDCCCMPTKIIIDISQNNGGLPVGLVSIGSNKESAATVTVIDNTSSDYNNDFSNDFGGNEDKQILYLLNTGFWSAYDAIDVFPYTISYKGQTATNNITIQKSSGQSSTNTNSNTQMTTQLLR